MTHSTVLVVEDEPTLREALCDSLDLAGYPVAAAGNGAEAVRLLADCAEGIGMVISDVQMKPMDGYALLNHIRSNRPEIPVLMMTAYGTIQQAVQAMQAGAVDYLVKPFDSGRLVEMVERHMMLAADGDEMVMIDPASRYMANLARRVAVTDATIMITGESGVGKEVLARYIHRHSPRAQHPFVAINCAAIPDNMLEATLFGYEKGAFTGAYNACPGKFEQAQHGTLLLDEISEMDLGLQAKLLRVLQEREVERLGGRGTIALDVRILATSNRNLRDEVSAGRFREDLFYRLNVFPLQLPPLRERGADILPLARRMLGHGAHVQGRAMPELTAAAEQRLLDHRWPGNVRELDNVIQRALILQVGPVIDAEDLQIEEVCPAQSEQALAVPGTAVLGEDLRGREQQLILGTLASVRGSRRAAAQRLGISERTLRYKLARLREAGLELPD
ncbi:MAG: sigma-54-dependent Fis family transcriptional regulator [Gammaproteobacteria bacterium]|nr:sigma-54-dependent Fis family transcriptional regulator [Gammaproteobacteria bacterium]